MFVKLTWTADPCGEVDERDEADGQAFIVNLDLFDMVYPDGKTGGAILRYRADYDRALDPMPPSPRGRSTYHIHVKETVDEIWNAMDARFLAALPR